MTRKSRGTGLFWAGLLAAVVYAAPAAAQASPDQVVRARNEAVQKALAEAGDDISDATRERLKDVINGLIDFRELSKRALRRHWDRRSPEEQERFVEVFRELVRNSSVQKLEVYEADSITYEPAEVEGDQARVVTHAFEDGKSVEIVYLMHRVDGEWKAYDVIIDGSSTLRTYMDSFQREIRASSFEAMLRRMEEKLEKDGGTPA